MYISQESQLKPAFRALFNQAEIMINNGKKIIVEVVEKKQKRSNEQNAYYWIFNGQLADFLDNAGLTYGEHHIPYTGELIHEINKRYSGLRQPLKCLPANFASI